MCVIFWELQNISKYLGIPYTLTSKTESPEPTGALLMTFSDWPIYTADSRKLRAEDLLRGRMLAWPMKSSEFDPALSLFPKK